MIANYWPFELSNEDRVRDFIQTYPVPDRDVRTWNDQCDFFTPYSDLRGLPMMTVDPPSSTAQIQIASSNCICSTLGKAEWKEHLCIIPADCNFSV